MLLGEFDWREMFVRLREEPRKGVLGAGETKMTPVRKKCSTHESRDR